MTTLEEHVEQSRAAGQQGRLHSVSETASYLGVSPSMVRKMIADGRIEVVRLGRRVLVPPSEVARLMRGA